MQVHRCIGKEIWQVLLMGSKASHVTLKTLPPPPPPPPHQILYCVSSALHLPGQLFTWCIYHFPLEKRTTLFYNYGRVVEQILDCSRCKASNCSLYVHVSCLELAVLVHIPLNTSSPHHLHVLTSLQPPHVLTSPHLFTSPP